MDTDVPPISWPLWRRLKVVGGMGVLCGAIVIALTLLVADIPGERAFNELTPGGAVPLWPTIRMLGMFAIAGPLAIALSLPLYRQRHGWAAIAAIVYLVLVASALGAQGGGSFPSDPLTRMQLVVAIIGIAVLVGVMAHEGRAFALGEADDLSSGPPPVT